MLPAALSTLTTSFPRGFRPEHRARRLGRGRGPVIRGRRAVRRPADPGSRLALGDVRQPDRVRPPARPDLPDDPQRAADRKAADFDFPGAVLATGGMLLLVFALVKAPNQGWGRPAPSRTLIGRGRHPRRVHAQRAAPPQPPACRCRSSGVRGLAAADATQFIAFAGFNDDVSSSSLSTCRTSWGTRPSRPASPTCRSASRRRVRRDRRRPAAVPGRHSAADHRGRDRHGGRRLLAVPHPGTRLVPDRPAARHAGHVGGHRRDVRRRSHRRQRRRAPRSGRSWPPRCSTPRSRSAARLASRSLSAIATARSSHLAGGRHPGTGRAHRRLPARPARRQHRPGPPPRSSRSGSPTPASKPTPPRRRDSPSPSRRRAASRWFADQVVRLSLSAPGAQGQPCVAPAAQSSCAALVGAVCEQCAVYAIYRRGSFIKAAMHLFECEATFEAEPAEVLEGVEPTWPAGLSGMSARRSPGWMAPSSRASPAGLSSAATWETSHHDRLPAPPPARAVCRIDHPCIKRSVPVRALEALPRHSPSVAASAVPAHRSAGPGGA